MRAVIYSRISNDRSQGAGTANQVRVCTELAQAKGYRLVATPYQEQQSGKDAASRPQYQDMLRLIEAGSTDVIVTYHPDRLARNVADREHLRRLCRQHKVSIHAFVGGELDWVSSHGIMSDQIQAAVDEHKINHQREQQQLKAESNYLAGRPHGRVAYGWTRHKGRPDRLHPQQAELIRQLADGVLAHKSLRGMAKELEARGIKTPHGAEHWESVTILGLLRRKRNIGILERKGHPDRPGNWEPLMDEEKWRAVVETLDNDFSRARRGHRNVPKSLLGGIARCGVCDGLLTSGTNGAGLIAYRCNYGGHVARQRSQVDEYVQFTMIALLDNPQALAQFLPNEELARTDRARKRALEEQLREWESQPDIRPHVLAEKTRSITADIDLIVTRMASRPQVSMLDGLSEASTAAVFWEALDLNQQRELVRMFMEVKVHKSRRGSRTFDPASVAIAWKDMASLRWVDVKGTWADWGSGSSADGSDSADTQ